MSAPNAQIAHDCEAERVGVEIWGVYDGVLFWQCGICRRAWHRFAEGHWLRERAARFVDGNEWPMSPSAVETKES